MGRFLQEAEPYTVPEGGAMGILFGVLCLTGLLCVAGIVLDKGSTFKDVLRELVEDDAFIQELHYRYQDKLQG